VFTYRLDTKQDALNLLTYKKPGEDGYFLLLATASDGRVAEEPVNYTFVIDVSGSMRRGRKIDIAAEGIVRFLKASNGEDRFNCLTFNVTPDLMSPDCMVNRGDNHDRLKRYLGSFKGVGGTDLYPALELALSLKDTGRENAVVIFSDGGLNDLDEKHGRFLKLLEGTDVKVFGIAIGNDANVPLLQAVADATAGFFTQISTEEDFEERGAVIRNAMSREPWTDIRLDVDGVAIGRPAPSQIPVLYPGGQLAVYGRYSAGGSARVSLKGKLDGKTVRLRKDFMFDGENRLNPELARMWALRRVEDLMQGIRARGEDGPSVNEIVRLGEGHSIVTRYTSFIVLETDQMFKDAGISRRNHALLEEERQARVERNRRVDAKVLKKKKVDPVGKPSGLDMPRGISGGSMDGGVILLTVVLLGLFVAAHRR
jgi:Ca-activated chloride channel family protein